MRTPLALWSLVCLMLAGCAHEPPRAVTYSTAELGLAHYLPEATLTVARESAGEYLAKMYVGRKNFLTSQVDGLMVMALESLAKYCPAWRIASNADADSMMIQELSAPAGNEWFRIQLSPKGPWPAGGRDSERRVFIKFSDEDWKYVQKNICARADQFNAQGLVR